eukprot:7900624-Pyramimonas_sp.AAC.1
MSLHKKTRTIMYLPRGCTWRNGVKAEQNLSATWSAQRLENLRGKLLSTRDPMVSQCDGVF